MKKRLGISSSTRAFFEAGRDRPDISRFDRLHGYVYARWPYLYIRIGTGEHWLARVIEPLVGWLSRVFPARSQEPAERVTLADTYHGKVVPPAAARQLVTVQEDISLLDLEKVVPYKRARDIVMQDPGHIVALECPCRASRPDPCKPLDVCLIIGEPFAGLVMEHHAGRARWISSAEAEAILAAEHARGHVAHAFFKDAMLGRFYAICNCCSCCCGAMQAHRSGTPMLASSGYVARVDESQCLACGQCVEACQFGALALNGNDTVAVDWAACMGCGVCESRCPNQAISLVRDPAKGAPLELQSLLAEAATCA